MRIFTVAVAALVLSGCTYGAPSSAIGSDPNATTIDVSLTAHATQTIDAGTSGGYAPARTVVSVGMHIRFVNRDSFAHTASSVRGTTFPSASPLDATALNPTPGSLSSGWSSGNLTAGSSSPVLVADRAGVYLYGCFYHYGAPMRGEIVVQ